MQRTHYCTALCGKIHVSASQFAPAAGLGGSGHAVDPSLGARFRHPWLKTVLPRLARPPELAATLVLKFSVTFADSADSATFTTVWVRCERQSRHGRRRLLRTAGQGARRAEGRRPSAAWMAAAEPFTLGTGARDGFTACLCPSARRAPGFAEHISRGPSTL